MAFGTGMVKSSEDEAALRKLLENTAALLQVTAGFERLLSQGHTAAESPDKVATVTASLLKTLDDAKGSLSNCPLGDPARVAAKPALKSTDTLVSAFGEASLAVFKATLAALSWQAVELERRLGELPPEAVWAAVVSIAGKGCLPESPEQLLSQFMMEAAGASRTGLVQRVIDEASHAAGLREAKDELAEVFLRRAELHARLLDFDSGHRDLQRSLHLRPGIPQAMMLARQYAMARAAAAGDVLHARSFDATCDGPSPWEECGSELQALRELLLELGYTRRSILALTGADSLLSLFVGGVPQQHDGSLSPPPPLKLLVDLFLLRELAPLGALVEALGAPMCELLLRHQVISCCAGESATPVELEEALTLLSGNPLHLQASVFANVALWPVLDDLILATDCDEQAFEEGVFEPVMYISPDSHALLLAAPHEPRARHVLDACCGCGIQGLAALAEYADEATLVDANPRALAFACFNSHLNGLANRVRFVCADLRGSQLPLALQRSFDVVLANPPFVPNPDKVATVLGPLYSSGGRDGQDVLAAIIGACAAHWLGPGGRLTAVAQVPNVEQLPERLRAWLGTGVAAEAASDLQAEIFRSEATVAEEFLAEHMRERPEVERRCYLRGLRDIGIRVMSDVVISLWRSPRKGLDKTEYRFCLHPAHRDLWSDERFLQEHIQHKVGEVIAAECCRRVQPSRSSGLDSLD